MTQGGLAQCLWHLSRYWPSSGRTSRPSGTGLGLHLQGGLEKAAQCQGLVLAPGCSLKSPLFLSVRIFKVPQGAWEGWLSALELCPVTQPASQVPFFYRCGFLRLSSDSQGKF